MDSDTLNFADLLKDPRVLLLKEALGPSAQLFLVGGCVRDFLLGRQIKDLDLCSPLSAAELKALLESKSIRCIETGLRHGTVTAVVNSSNIEITSFRGGKSESRQAETDLHADLALRDFTINSIALSVDSEKLIDPLNACQDLKNCLLKAPALAADRFKEDPLRIMRMIRFGPAQNFQVEPETYQAARKNIELIKTVSIERIQHEFSGILLSPNPRAAIKMMLEIGLLDIYIPEALAAVDFEQNDFHTESVFDHTLTVVENTPLDLKLRLAGFFHDLGKPSTLSTDELGKRHFYEHEIKSAQIVREVMPRLRYSNDLTDSVNRIVLYHMRPVNCGPSGIRRLLRDLDLEFQSWRKFKEADYSPTIPLTETLAELANFDKKVQEELDRNILEKLKKLVVSGHEFMALGIQAGPALGSLIKQLEEEVLDDPGRNNKEYLLTRAREIIAES